MTNNPQYRTILIDPPWPEFGGGKIKRGADRHYALLKPPEILRVILESGIFNPASDCHMFLWSTNNHLKDAMELIEQLKFRYITNLVWVKDRFGLGQYFRGQHEILLFAVRGNLRTRNRKTSTVIFAKRTKHSQKPGITYSIIENVSYPPRLEMFARDRREGWDAWGLESNGPIQRLLL